VKKTKDKIEQKLGQMFKQLHKDASKIEVALTEIKISEIKEDRLHADRFEYHMCCRVDVAIGR